MEKQANTALRVYAGIAAIIGWFAVLMQFYLILLNRVVPWGETVIRFFSYFTILTNIAVAITFTSAFVMLNTGLCRFCGKSSTLTAVTGYIIIVGATYNLILRGIWNPEGLQRVVDELLHSVIPVLSLLFWLLFVPKKSLQWKNCLPWLIFPLLYSVLVAIRGIFSGFYPYPFIDVSKLGYQKAVINGVLLLILFLLVSLVLISIAKILGKYDRKDESKADK